MTRHHWPRTPLTLGIMAARQRLYCLYQQAPLERRQGLAEAFVRLNRITLTGRCANCGRRQCKGHPS